MGRDLLVGAADSRDGTTPRTAARPFALSERSYQTDPPPQKRLKDYVLTLLFMKYVSEKYAGKPDAVIKIPPGGGFADMAKVKGDKEIGDKLDKIIARLAAANDLKGS
jgi:hypothetical protein